MIHSVAILEKLRILERWVGEPPDFKTTPPPGGFFELGYGIDTHGVGTDNPIKYQWTVTIFPPGGQEVVFSRKSVDLNVALNNALNYMVKKGYLDGAVQSE